MLFRLFFPLAALLTIVSGQLETAAADANLLAAESFDNCAFSGQFNGSYIRSEFYPPGTSPFVAMDGHGCVMEQRIPAGVDDITPAQVGMEGSDGFTQVTGSPDADEFYVEWEEFYPPDHDFADGAQKMLRFIREGGPAVMLQNQYNNANLQISIYHPSGVDIFQNTQRSVPLGRWVSFGVWCRLNTPRELDGFCRAYMDGEQIVDMSSINMRGSDTRGWDIMWVGGNHTNQKPTVKTSLRFIDNIRWYNTKPSGSSGLLPPPGFPPAGRSTKRAPGDIDGDGKTDFRVVRGARRTSNATVYTRRSSDGAVSAEALGNTSEDLFLDADVDGDWKADTGFVRALRRRSINWFYRNSSAGQAAAWAWGMAGDVPLTADIDGDGYSDSTVFRPADGTWWSIRSRLGVLVLPWGLSGDLPVAEDYDGDGWDDVAVYRPSSGYWAVLKSTRGASTSLEDIIWKQWGLPGDHPMPGDFDGDGKSDLVVYRPSSGIWCVCRSSEEFDCRRASMTQFGLPGDYPVKGDFDGDGILDFAVWRPSTGQWFYRRSSSGEIEAVQWGFSGDWPILAGVKETASRIGQ
jgi:hypothetical protein